MKLCLKMTGCKNNRYELDQVILWCAENGVELVTDDRKADFCVINTCTVTHVADKKSRQLIRKTKHANPKLKTIVFGCAARMQKETFEKIKEIDCLVPDLEEVLNLLEKQKPVANAGATLTSHFPDGGERSRALVQIQDGCENFCTYCIIARARGRSKNRPVEDIITEINRHVKNGFNEIVLTGINIGAYGASQTTKPEESRLAELLETILQQTTIPRIRLSSLGPQYFNEKLFSALKNPRICRHIHLSIQSGSDTALKRMNRQYAVTDTERVIRRLRKDIPGIAITTDIIVGFPEETEAEYKETLDFVKRNPLAKAHIFPYSIRPDTLAATMEQVPDSMKKARAKKLQALADQQRRDFIESQLGKKVSVLWEKADEGLTDNYIRVKGQGTVRSIAIKKLMKKDII